MSLIKFSRRFHFAGVAVAAFALTGPAFALGDPLSSWNDGPTKTAIIEFVKATTTEGSPKFVAREARIATFDQDGTLWTEHPIYSQLMFALSRVPALVKAKPELAAAEPFKTILSGDRAAIGALTTPDLEKIVAYTMTGMTVDQFNAEAAAWLATAKDPRFGKLYTELTFKPMLEVMSYLRDRGFKTYIVTGGGIDFVRVYAEKVYGVPPEQIVGSAGATAMSYDAAGNPVLNKLPKLLLNNDAAGKVENIDLMIGRRPIIAFGNSNGDKEMLQYATGGTTPGLSALVLHDDAAREYAYGPARGLPETKVGTFSQALYDEAQTRKWHVISMKTDWKQVYGFSK